MNKICQVMEVLTATLVSAFMEAAIEKPNAKATSMSRILKSEETCIKFQNIMTVFLQHSFPAIRISDHTSAEKLLK